VHCCDPSKVRKEPRFTDAALRTNVGYRSAVKSLGFRLDHRPNVIIPPKKMLMFLAWFG